MPNTTANTLLLTKYQEADRLLRLQYLKIGIILILILVPMGISLDLMVYPEILSELLSIRLVTDALIVGILVSLYTPLKKYLAAIGVGTALIVNAGICWMIFITEGAASPYYAGLNIILAFIGLMPWTVRENALTCIGTMAAYLCACYLHHSSSANSTFDWSIFYNNVYFITLISISSLTITYYQSRRRFSEFCLNHELDLRNKQLAELDRLKSEFFANISHELRTPLTLILAPLQDLIQKNTLTKNDAATLTTAQDSAFKLLKLVNDLLEIVRLEEGKTKLKMNPVELISLINGLIESVSHLARKKDITIDKYISDEKMPVLGDLRALEKVFLNILINAIKFTDPGGHISVASRFSLAAQQGIIEITDTGIGISDSELPFIFDRFHQADGSSTRKQQGTGLGLALARELTEKHGGAISAVSTPGAGTTISIALPLLNAVIDAQPVEHSDESDPIEKLHRQAELSTTIKAVSESAIENDDVSLLSDQSAIDTSRPTLLIVEDEPDMLHYLANMLKDDYRIYQATDGRQGLVIAHRFHPDLVLLDLMLPEIDGLEVCKAIKEDDKIKHTKVMLLTARVDETAKLSALKLGADDFLTKPFSSLEVKTRLSNLYQTTQLQRDLNTRNAELNKTLDALRQAQSQLLQSEKLNALGKLSAGLLHEINNPLNYTLTALQIALSDPVIKADEGLLEICHDVNDGMQRIRSIVTDLRAFAYPTEAEKESLFYFRAALDNALRFTSQEYKGLIIDNQGCNDVTIMGSQTHITQVLVNLISNAADAIHKAQRGTEGKIEIHCRPDPAKGRLNVCVKDNGTGIEKDALQYVFDPFYTTRDVGQGMGLGLSICHTIIKNHGGALIVDSELGHWTAFYFDLALAPNEKT